MQRFYLPSPDIKKNVIEIHDPRIVYQCSRVLRMRTGSNFSVFDENGKEVLVEILEINRRKIIGNIIEKLNETQNLKYRYIFIRQFLKKPHCLKW